MRPDPHATGGESAGLAAAPEVAPLARWWAATGVAFRASWRGLAWFGLVYGVLYAISMRLITSANPLAPLWPPAGVLVAGLLLLDTTPRWMIFLTSFVAGRVAGQGALLPGVETLVLIVAAWIEGRIVSDLLRQRRGPVVTFGSVRDIPALLWATMLAVSVNGVIVGAISADSADSFWQGFITSWIGGCLGILLFTPLLVAWVRPPEVLIASGRRSARLLEAAALLAVTVVITRLAFQGVVLFGAIDVPPYALTVPLIWAALRFGLRGVTLVSLVITALATPLQLEPTATVLGGVTPDVRLLRLQVFIAFITMTGLVLSAARAEQRAAAASEALAAEALVASERQLRQSQKMEAVGQLAGGVAHDFNNILAAMLLQVQEIRAATGLAPAERRTVGDLNDSIERAATLTRQLLLFSRRQAKEERLFDLGEMLAPLARLLRRIVPESFAFTIAPATAPMMVRGDSSMLEQVVMNLVVNARDAMPGGGALHVNTAIISLAGDEWQALAQVHRDLRPGGYAVLRVTDTGHGIAPEHLGQLFEPFFTTKEAGKGTGLGLSTVYGIAQQHHGFVRVLTTSAAGTTFEFGIPLVEDAAPEVSATPVIAQPVIAEPVIAEPVAVEPIAVEPVVTDPSVPTLEPRRPTILLVEDDPDVRRMVQRMLERGGMRVVSVETGLEALARWQDIAPVDLVLTDLVMPGGMSGIEMAHDLQSIAPGLRVVYTSGYDPDYDSHGGLLDPGLNFIPKPASADTILSVIRRQLGDAWDIA